MDFMRNLREETISFLKEHGKKWSDVVGVCGNDFQITKDQFWELANKMYDSGYGGNEVAIDLKVVGKDFWLERHEYDGEEWWEYKEIPNLSALPVKKVDRIICDADHCLADSISKLNKNED